MQFVAVNGTALAYDESGEGEPLLIMHGANSDRKQYDIFRPLLGPGIRAITYDQRDAPDSPWGGGEYEMADHADDAAALLAGLRLERAHVVGVSYGGAVAMTLAIRHPGRLKSLVLAATVPSYDMLGLPDPEIVKDMNAEAFSRYMLERGISPDAIDRDPTLVAETQGTIVERAPKALSRRMGALSRFDARNQLAGITAPTLVLAGELDPIAPMAAAEYIANRIARAQLVILEGSRHGLTIEHRQRTAGIIREFVLRHGAGPAP